MAVRTVMVSSTARDLDTHRNAVLKACLEAGKIVDVLGLERYRHS